MPETPQTCAILVLMPSIEDMGRRIFELILATASGQQSKSERHGYGQSEFVPWQIGAVM